jgi:hypothetical protein
MYFVFRFIGSGKHIGKVLLKIRDEEPEKVVKRTTKLVSAIPRTYMNPDKSYILVGKLENKCSVGKVTNGCIYFWLFNTNHATLFYKLCT